MASKLFVIAGPSGVGKSYLIEEILRLFPGDFVSPPIFTTRSPRSGEGLHDRIFVSKADFDIRAANDEFFIAEEFHGNWYGFTREGIKPKDKHVIINAWPALLPRFATDSPAVLLGMTIAEEGSKLLYSRMVARGDNVEIATKRMEQVKVDVKDLERYRTVIAQKGKMFTVTDDATINEQIIPWITEQTKR